MVTLQELEQREKQLIEQENLARRLSQQKVPQRKFGAGVTPKRQKEVVSQIEQGKQSLSEIQRQRREIGQAKEILLEQQRSQESRNRIISVVQSALKTGRAPGLRDLNREEREVAKQLIKEAEDRSERQAGAQAIRLVEEKKGQSLNVEQRLLVAREAIREGKITLGQETINFTPPTFKEKLLGQSLAQDREFNSKPLSADFRLQLGLAEFKTGIQQKDFSKTLKGTGIILTVPETRISEINERVVDLVDKTGKLKKEVRLTDKISFTGRAGLRTTLDIGTFSLPVVRQVREVTFTSSVVGKKLAKEEVSFFEGLGVGAIVGSRAFSFLNTRVKFTEPIKQPKVKSEAQIFNIFKGEKQITVGQFKIDSLLKSRRQFVTTRLEVFRSRVLGFAPPGLKPVKELTFKEATKLFTGRIQVIQPRREAIVIPETFVIKDGRTISSLARPGQNIGFIGARGTSKRVSSQFIGTFEGATSKGVSLKKISPGKLSKQDQAILNKIQSVSLNKKLKVSKRFSPDTEISFGETVTQDILKLSIKGELKGLGLQSSARSTSRSRIAIIQEKISTTELENTLGLKRVETFSERIGTADITLPSSRVKRPSLISGRTKVFEIVLPEEKSFIPVNRGVRSTKPKPITIQENLKLANVLKASLSTRALKAVRTNTRVTVREAEQLRIQSLSLSVGGGGRVTSPFLSGSSQNNLSQLRSDNLPKERTISISREVIINVQQPRQITRTNAREISRTLSREVVREVSLSLTRSTTRQITRTTPRTITRSSFNRNVPKINIKVPKSPIKSKPLLFGRLSINTSSRISSTTGFRTFFLVRGKKVFLPGVRTRSQALRFGEQKTLQTLRATFGIEQTKIRVKESEDNFKVSQRAFRTFRIRGNKRIALRDTFIQRQRKEGGLRGGRLSTRAEIMAIQRLR